MGVGHRGDRGKLTLDGVKPALDPALAGEDLLHLCGVDLLRAGCLGRLHPEDTAAAGHRGTD
jgi:hypothetical protein